MVKHGYPVPASAKFSEQITLQIRFPHYPTSQNRPLQGYVPMTYFTFFRGTMGVRGLNPGLRIRIHFIRIRIQHFRLNTDPDPDPIRIQGLNDQKLKKITAEKKN
jgi:hypothetical protein